MRAGFILKTERFFFFVFFPNLDSPEDRKKEGPAAAAGPKKESLRHLVYEWVLDPLHAGGRRLRLRPALKANRWPSGDGGKPN